MIKKLFSTTLLGSYLNIVRLLTNLIRVKYLAVAVGAGGIGLVSQGTQIQLLLATLGSMGITVGIISRLKEGKSSSMSVLSTAFTIQLFCCIVLLITSLFFRDHISEFFFGTPNETIKVMLIIASVPFAVFASNYLESIFFWKDRYDLYIRASIIANLIGLFATVSLIYLFGLTGAFMSIWVAAFALFITFSLATSRIHAFREMFRFGFHTSELKHFWRISVVMFLSSIGTYGSQWILRRAIIDTAGVETNGLIQVPFALSNFYLPFLISALWGHFHPTVSQKGYGRESLFDLLITLRFIICATLISALGLLVWPELLVSIAFSKHFLESITLIPQQLLGDWFYIVVFTMSVYLLGIHRLRLYAYLWITYYGIYVIYGLITIYNGIWAGYFHSYILSGVITVALTIMFLFLPLEFKKVLDLIMILLVGTGVLIVQGWILSSNQYFFYRLILPSFMILSCLLLAKRMGLPIREYIPFLKRNQPLTTVSEPKSSKPK